MAGDLMRWLRNGTADELLAAVTALDDRFALPATLRPKPGVTDAQWRMTTARLGEKYVVKFAWSEQAAERLSHEISTLQSLHAGGVVQHLPEIVVEQDDPVLLVTRYVAGTSLFEAAGTLDLSCAGRQLGSYLAGLHSALMANSIPPVARLVGYPAEVATLQAELPKYLDPTLQGCVERLCAWIDQVLSQPAVPDETVLVHGDLNGDNQIWRDGELQVVLDYETVALGEPEYDFRVLLGVGEGSVLFDGAIDEYESLTGRAVGRQRALAWHVRSALDDILWRTKARVPLPDGREPGPWLADISGQVLAACNDA